MICMSGTPTIMPNVTRSRESWRTSLMATARRRRIAPVNLLAATLFSPRRHDEHVFEAGIRELDLRVDGVLLQQCAQLDLGILHIAIREHAQPNAELCYSVHPWKFAYEAGRLAPVRTFDFVDVGLDPRHQVARCAFGHHATLGDDRQTVAALGLVHVVSRHEDGGAGLGELEQPLPEIAPALWIHRAGRFVEQQ